MNELSVRKRVLAAWQVHRDAAEASRRASQALSLELAAAVRTGVTGYRLAKWLGVADSAVRKRLRHAQRIRDLEGTTEKDPDIDLIAATDCLGAGVTNGS